MGMKKALVFRTAQAYVVSALIRKLERKKYETWCVVQEASLESMKREYPNINFLTIDETFFDFKEFKRNKRLIKQLGKIKFDRVFVPSSTNHFNNFLEVRRIIYSLGYRKVTYFIALGEAVTQKLDLVEISLERVLDNRRFMALIFALNDICSWVCYFKNRLLKGLA